MKTTRRVLEDIGTRIYELRCLRGMTQEKLAAKLRIEPRTLQRIEHGMNITLPMLIQVSRELRAPIASLFEAPRTRIVRRPGRPRKVKESR